MPAPIAPLVGFVLGVGFAWAAADELARQPATLLSRSLWLSMLFSLLVFGPIVGFFMSFAPDWAYAYLVDTSRLPRAVDLGLVLLAIAGVPLGFVAAARSASLRRLGMLLRIAAVPATLAGAFLAVTIRRLGVHGTYRQFHGDFGTQSITGTPLAYGLLWMLVVLVGAAVWTAHSVRELSRPSRL